MMPTEGYTDYVFRIRVEGSTALAQASKLQKELEQALTGSKGSMAGVAKTAQQVERLNKAITSGTRRWSYHIRRLQEVSTAYDQLAGKLSGTTAEISKSLGDPFRPMVDSAAAAKKEIVGQSIIPDMVARINALMQQLQGRMRQAFAPMSESARQAASETITAMSQVSPAAQRETFVGERFRAMLAGPPATELAPTSWMAQSMQAAQMAQEMERAESRTRLFARAMNEVAAQYWGIRRLTYGVIYLGRQAQRWGESILGTLDRAGQLFLEFDRQAVRLQSVADVPAQMTDYLRDSLVEASIEARRFPLPELTEGVYKWAAGTGAVVESQEDVNEMLEQAIVIAKLSAIHQADVGDVTRDVGASMHEYGVHLDDTRKTAALFNYVTQTTFAELEDVGATFSNIGPMMAQFGFTLEESTALLGMLADANIRGSKAGTVMRQTVRSMTKPTEELTETMNRLLGLPWDAPADAWKQYIFPEGEFIGAVRLLDELAAGLEEMPEAFRQFELAQITTARAAPGLAVWLEETLAARAWEPSFSAMEAILFKQQGVVNEVTVAYDQMTQELYGFVRSQEGALAMFEDDISSYEESLTGMADQTERTWEAIASDFGNAFEKWILPYLSRGSKAAKDFAEALLEIPQLAPVAGIVGAGLKYGGAAVSGVGTLASAYISLKTFQVAFKTYQQLIGKGAEDVAAGGSMIRGAGSTIRGAVATFVSAVSRFALHIGIVVGGFLIARELLDELEKQRQQMTQRFIAEGRTRAELEKLAGLELVSPTLASAAAAALKELESRAAVLPPILKEFESSIDESTISVGRFGGVLDGWTPMGRMGVSAEGYATLGLTDARAITGGYQPVPARLTMPAGLGDILEEYQEYLDGVEELNKEYNRRNEKLQRDHEKDLTELAEDRSEGRVEVQEKYAESIEGTMRSYYRSIEDAEEAHQRKLLDIAEAGADRRTQLLESQQTQITDLLTAYEQRVADYTADFWYDESYARQEAARRRQEIIDDFAEKEVEAEEGRTEKLRDLYAKYLKDILRMREDHVDRMWELVAARDARGLLNEMRSFGKRRTRRYEDYLDAVEKEKETTSKLKDQLAERLEEFDRAEQRRRESTDRAYRRQLERMAREHARQLDRLKERHKKELVLLEEAIRKQEATQERAYKKRLARMAEDLRDRLAQMEEDHQRVLRKYDDETIELREKLRERHREMVAEREVLHQEELSILEEDAKESINVMLDAMEGVLTERGDAWIDMARELEEWLGRDIEALKDWKDEVCGIAHDAANCIVDAGNILEGIEWGPIDVWTSPPSAEPTGGGGGGGVRLGGPIESAGYVAAAGTRAPSGASRDPWQRAIASLRERGIDPEIAGMAAGAVGAAAAGIVGAAAQTPTLAVIGATSAGAVAYEELYRQAASAYGRYGIDWALLAAQGWHESRWNPKAVSSAGAQGIAQFMPGTWEGWGGGGDPFDPVDAIPAQAKHMSYLVDYMSKQYGKPRSIEWALAAYLHGAFGASKYENIWDFPSASRGYIRNIINTAAGFRTKYGYAKGGLISRPGMYMLAEEGPELVLPAALTKFILDRPGRSGRPMPTTIIVRQEGWTFAGALSESEKRAAYKMAKNAAYTAIAEVLE